MVPPPDASTTRHPRGGPRPLRAPTLTMRFVMLGRLRSGGVTPRTVSLTRARTGGGGIDGRDSGFVGLGPSGPLLRGEEGEVGEVESGGHQTAHQDLPVSGRAGTLPVTGRHAQLQLGTGGRTPAGPGLVSASRRGGGRRWRPERGSPPHDAPGQRGRCARMAVVAGRKPPQGPGRRRECPEIGRPGAVRGTTGDERLGMRRHAGSTMDRGNAHVVTPPAGEGSGEVKWRWARGGGEPPHQNGSSPRCGFGDELRESGHVRR
ncbi:hypothetical protein SAVIM338S_00913 [Streptomyces avidinii]